MKGLVITAIFAVGILGCGQEAAPLATVAPETLGPTVASTALPNGLVLPTPTVANTAATNELVPPTPATAEPESGGTQLRPVVPGCGGFVPLDNPVFLAANETEYFGDEELVLGVEFADEIRAYPVRMLRYHYIVNDNVGGEPLLVTY